MSDAPVEQEPWVELARLFDADEVDELATFVEGLPPAELARAMSRLDESQQKGNPAAARGGSGCRSD